MPGIICMLQTIYMYYVTIHTANNINYYVISVLFWFVAAIPMPCMLLCYLLDCIVECYYLAKSWYYETICLALNIIETKQ